MDGCVAGWLVEIFGAGRVFGGEVLGHGYSSKGVCARVRSSLEEL